ncbi:protein translocase subunit SecD [Conexibacter sp. SYSU D00693]|uniref:protein translocase subunit SecD n=1 Tax=Conexibacter sp. SYSU D00693 TaxID=2812560 RepID=UPI00196B0232|nr:protein translocase subunit SecD [Conexibacter sp. SYSU D00693]
MTDRRRNVFILLLVAGLLAASAFVLATKETKLGLDLEGGVSLVYQASPTRNVDVTPDSVDRAIDIMRERVDRLGVAEPEIARQGADQIEVQLPGATNVQRAIDQVGTTAQLYFYDWEKNVLNADCETDPTDANVTGGPSAGNPGAGTIPYYGAVIRASRCPATNEPDDTTQGLFFGVDDKAKKVMCGPLETEADLREACREDRKRITSVREVKRGTIVVQSEAPEGDSPEEKAARVTAEDAYYVLRDDPALSGTDIKNPEQQFDNGPGGSGQPNVTFEFSDSGAKKWQTVTREIAQRGQEQSLPGTDPRAAAQHFAIVLDNELVSAPYIDFRQNPDGIDGRTGSEISGGFTISSAQNLADLLKSGALPLKLQLISQSQVSASLGQQALDDGAIAGLAGFVVVALFLLLVYRFLGVIAVGALVIYAVYFYALVKLIPVTLTLPGIAGLILTLGVAADANIVIFERVKEEIRSGRSVVAGIAAGYKRGLSAIIDANVVTFMVAFILFMLATAGVRGFALTLGLGTIVSLFTAVLATQAALGLMQRSRAISHPAMLGAEAKERPPRTRIDYMGYSKWFFSASGVIILIGAFALAGKGLEFGIDFESGSRIKASLTEQPNTDQVHQVLERAGFGDAEVQRVDNDSELGGSGYQISLPETGEQVAQVRPALEREFGAAKAFQSSSIGPTFGESIANSAIIAIIASLIVISVYVSLRFEWKYAVPVLIAVGHDILITAGVYALVGREVTTSTVAALLTILGFSLYDTIIVFDRIRENVPRMPRATFTQVVNRSMSEVIIRSLATSFCTLLPILALLAFGGETLQDFAFALAVGTFSGTYSSVFIASPVLAHWKEKEPLYRRRRRKMLEQLGEVPAYATTPDGKPLEIQLSDDAPRRGRLTSPDDPERRVSQREFQQLVEDIQHETGPQRTATEERPDGRAADAAPEDLVMKDDKRANKPKRPRNKRHGRPR